MTDKILELIASQAKRIQDLEETVAHNETLISSLCEALNIQKKKSDSKPIEQPENKEG